MRSFLLLGARSPHRQGALHRLAAALLANRRQAAHANSNNHGNSVAMANAHSLRCWFNRHEPDRDAVQWDGYHYVSTCRHCAAVIRRREKKRWERDWMKVVA
jgi:hypothetical protein